MFKIKNNPVLYVTLLSVVGILAIFVLSLNQFGLLDPAVVVGRELLDEGEYQSACVDSDPTNLFEVKGEVEYFKYKYNDLCIGEKLHQVFCDSSLVVRLGGAYECPNGCLDGVCL